MKRRIAVIDDEHIVCKRLEGALSKEGYEVETFTEAGAFLERMEKAPFHVVFTDLRLPDMDGFEVLSWIKENQRITEVIIITGYGSINNAIEAIKAGAYHYVTKPLKLGEIRLLAKRALEKIEMRVENQRLREALTGKDALKRIVGKSPAMQEVFSLIRKVAAVDCNVLLQGASGTGKELAARAIHQLSPRKDRPFVSFNCGGFTEELISSELFGYEKGAFTGAIATKIGLLESASGGTVFLDEIAEMPLPMQVKLLHVIQEKRILRVGGVRPIDLDIRIIAATNRDLKHEASSGRFREDLFYRLKVVSIHLPALAERMEDIPLITQHLMEKYCLTFGKHVTGIHPQVLQILMNYSFPGNVRELENIIERAVALTESDQIKVQDLPADLQKLEFHTFVGEELLSLEEMEKQYIDKVLKKTGYNKNLTAQILDVPRTTLWRKLKKYRLSQTADS